MKRQLSLAPFACALSLAATLFQPLFAQEVNATNPSSKADNEAATFIVFDVPNAQNLASAVFINASDTVVGTYSDAVASHGFYRLADGTISTFDVPGCADGQFGCTFPVAVNSDGTIIGYYLKSGYHGLPGGFILDRSGNYTKFDPVGSISTEPTAINSAGTITGWYVDSADKLRGFIRDTEGNITSFDAPPVKDSTAISTFPVAINSLGNITGWSLTEPTDIETTFLRESNGNFKAIKPKGFMDPFPVAITDGGKIIGHGTVKADNGYYVGESFIRDPEGNYTTLTLSAVGIDRNQTIVGPYDDATASIFSRMDVWGSSPQLALALTRAVLP